MCVNHALLLTGREALPPFEDVVIDEAHLLYHEATEAFSRQVDARSLDLLLADLRGHRRQRALGVRLRAAARGVEAAAREALIDGGGRLRTRRRHAAGPRARRRRHARRARRPRRGPARDDDRTTGGAPAGSRRHQRATTAPSGSRRGFASSRRGMRSPQATGLLGEGLTALAAAAAAAAEALPDEHRDHAAAATLADDAVAAGRRCSPTCRRAATPGLWCGARSRRAGRDGGASLFPLRWSLTSTPLTPAAQVREALWDRLRSAVLTSATLTVRDSFAYYRT